MKIAYLDCFSGISGDMMLGALVDAGIELDRLNDAVASLGLQGCRLVGEGVKKKGMRATLVRVEYQPEHVHRHLHHITAMIDGSRLTDRQKDLAKRIFTKLGEAEAKVHGTTLQKVHFHEVGAADSIADIVGSAVGWELLGVDRVVASPIPTGTGRITIAHGEFSVPAPATAELLRGIPIAESSVPFELTTPTGAAIVATMVQSFGPIPAMTIERIGCGAGQRDLETQANLVRLMVGAVAEPASTGDAEPIWMVETNLDDISGELIGYCITRLWDVGVLDVFTTPVQMKKNRPGTKLSVLCKASQLEAAQEILFAETTTLGIRRWPVTRSVLERKQHSVSTAWGPVEGKIGWLPDGPPRFSPEFESCRQLAAQHRLPLREIYEAAVRAFDPQHVE